jgi:hypothetical protein
MGKRRLFSAGWKAAFILGPLFLVLLLVPQPVLADIAPPEQPPGVNLLPGAESTQVRMVSESVLIDVLVNTHANSLGRAKVTARFSMRNLGEEDEKLAVRFPLTFLSGSDDGYGRYPEIKNFSARVNDRTIPVRRVSALLPGDPDKTIPWAEFDIIFPAGEEVPVEVSYLAEGAGEYPFISFKYILETGSGWKDTIGEALLTLRLPYEASNQNVIFDEQIGWSQTTPGGAISGHEVQWKWEDLEPTSADNLEISLVMPAIWKKVLDERANVTRDPEDGEAWGRLGKLYKEIISNRRGLRQDTGGKELYGLSVAAYEKALELLPGDALWHAGFAELLYRNYYWHQFFSENPDHSVMLRALNELRISLELDPDNTKSLEILDDMKYTLPEAVQQEGQGYLFPWLTATPTPRLAATEIPESVTLTATPDELRIDTPTGTITANTLQQTETPTPLPAEPVSQDDDPSETSSGQPLQTPESENGRLSVCGVPIALIAAVFFLSVYRRSEALRKRP